MAGHGRVVVISSKQEWDAKLHEANQKGQIVIVDFSAVWCGPCKLIAPDFERLSNAFTNAMFLKVDVDDVQAVAEECEISAMPTFQVFKDGRKIDQLVGASKDKLEALVRKHAA